MGGLTGEESRRERRLLGCEGREGSVSAYLCEWRGWWTPLGEGGGGECGEVGEEGEYMEWRGMAICGGCS